MMPRGRWLEPFELPTLLCWNPYIGDRPLEPPEDDDEQPEPDDPGEPDYDLED
jgi:hypothetical protein